MPARSQVPVGPCDGRASGARRRPDHPRARSLRAESNINRRVGIGLEDYQGAGALRLHGRRTVQRELATGLALLSQSVRVSPLDALASNLAGALRSLVVGEWFRVRTDCAVVLAQ